LYWEKSWPVCERKRELLQDSFSRRRRRREGQGLLPEGVACVGDELGRHLRRREDVIHQPGGDGTAGHAVVLGGVGVLGHGHAALAFDRPNAQGAIAAGAGEHNADGSLAPVQGERAEEEVDG